MTLRKLLEEAARMERAGMANVAERSLLQAYRERFGCYTGVLDPVEPVKRPDPEDPASHPRAVRLRRLWWDELPSDTQDPYIRRAFEQIHPTEEGKKQALRKYKE